jgi:Ino eighty subunit 2
VGGEIVTGARSARKKAIVEESSQEEDEEDDVEEEDAFEEDGEGEGDEDAEGEEDDEEMGDEDEDAEGEEDELMVDAPPTPPKGRALPKPQVQVTITLAKPLASVEEKEMAMDEEDDELSELEDEELEAGDDELGGGLGDEDEEDESDDEEISRSATPDPSKLTRRQRAEAAGLMALSNGSFSSHYLDSIFHKALITLSYRSTKEKTLHRGRNIHAPRRNGPPPQSAVRETQRRREARHYKPLTQKAGVQAAAQG